MPPSQFPSVATRIEVVASKPFTTMSNKSASELKGISVAAKKLAAKSPHNPYSNQNSTGPKIRF